MDTIQITILEDGSIKMETDKIGAANHGNAEMLVREMTRLAGGTVDVKRKLGHVHSTVKNTIQH